jgi:ATP-dependent protease ClpP protease subunit
MLFHDLGREFDSNSRFSLTELQRLVRNLEWQQRTYCEFVASRTNGILKPENVNEIMGKETYMRAEEALELGLVHEISKVG